MTRWRAVLATVVLMSGCSTTSSDTAVPTPVASSAPIPSPSAVARQVLPPARSLPLVALCSQPVTTDQYGDATPLLCTDGALNVLAWRFFAPLAPRVLSAGPTASIGRVQTALCRDVKISHAGVLAELSASDLATAYFGWRFDAEPTDILYSMSRCPT